MSFFRKTGKHYLCSEGQKECAFSLQLSVLGKWSFFWCPFKVTKHYKNRGFSRHGGKPKMALLAAKVPFWVFPRNGVLLSVLHKSCALLKTLFYSVCSKHSFVDMKNITWKKNKNLPKIGVVCQNAKRFFLGMFFFLLFGGFVFYCLYFCVCVL